MYPKASNAHSPGKSTNGSIPIPLQFALGYVKQNVDLIRGLPYKTSALEGGGGPQKAAKGTKSQNQG